MRAPVDNSGQQTTSTASNNNTSNHKRNFSSSNQSSSGHSSVVTSPDFLDQAPNGVGTPHYNEMPNVLQPVATFLEHAQINKANSSSTTTQSSDTVTNAETTKNLNERLKRVVNTLLKLRETVNDKALRHLKDTFESSLKGSYSSIVFHFDIWMSVKFTYEYAETPISWIVYILCHFTWG